MASVTGAFSIFSIGSGGVESAGLVVSTTKFVTAVEALVAAESCISFNCSVSDFSFDRRSRIKFWNSRSLSRNRSLRLLAPSSSVLADFASFSILPTRCFISSNSFWVFDPAPDAADSAVFSFNNCSKSVF